MPAKSAKQYQSDGRDRTRKSPWLTRRSKSGSRKRVCREDSAEETSDGIRQEVIMASAFARSARRKDEDDLRKDHRKREDSTSWRSIRKEKR